MSTEARKFNVAVAGATGAVGGAMLEVLARRDFPLGELRLLASERSVGKKLEFKGEKIPVQLLSEDAFADIDLALFSPGRPGRWRTPRPPLPLERWWLTTRAPFAWTTTFRLWSRR